MKETENNEARLCWDCKFEREDCGKYPCIGCFRNKAKINWQPKESEGKKMKLDLPVMLLSIKNNRTKIFRRIRDGLIIEADEDGNLIWESGHQKLNVNDEFVLAQKPVNFKEAVNSGRKIKAMGWEFYHDIKRALVILSQHNPNTIVEEINGEWLIQEDD